MKFFSKVSNLRGHHLKDFVHSKVLDFKPLKKEYNVSGTKIRVVADYDDICSKCKLRGSTNCDDVVNKGLIQEDKRLISEYGLQIGSVYSLSELIEIIRNYYSRF